EREHDDLQRRGRERKDEEDAGPDGVGEYEDPAPRDPVEEAAGQEADHNARQELGDEKSAHPRCVLRPVEHVDDERDERKPGPDRGRKRREEEEAESSGLPQEPDSSPPEASCHGPNRNSGGGGTGESSMEVCAPWSTRSSAAAKNSFPSAVTTVTRIAASAPNG